MEAHGFVIVRYAAGRKLIEEEEKIRQLWNASPKEAIRNEVESKSAQATAQKADFGRLQVHIQDDEILPGEEELKALFPRARHIPETTPLPRQRAILGNHPDALAQQVHWDQIPQDWSQLIASHQQKNIKYTQLAPGAAMLTFSPASLIVYPGAHNNLVGAYQHKPRRILIPAGCFILLSNTPHAGGGIWVAPDAANYSVLTPNDMIPVDTTTGPSYPLACR